MKSWVLVISLLITNMAMGQTIAEGLHLIDRDQPSRAKQVFEGLVTASPTGENYYYLGYYFLSRRDWAGAEDAFKKGLAADPKNYLNQVGLATIKVGQNKVNDAKVDFDRILQETKYKNGDVIHRIAEAYEMFHKLGRDAEFNANNNDPAEAIRLIDLMLEKTKKGPNAEQMIVRGDAFLIKNDGGNAVSSYEQALMQDPRNVKAKVKIGTVFLRGKNYRETQSRYKEAIDLDSNYAPAHKRYGEYLIVGAQFKNASRYFRKYLEKAEATPEVTLETAKLLFLSQDYEGAMKYTDEADKKGVKDNDIFRMRGYSHVEMKNYQQGIDNLEGMVRSGVKPYYADDLYFGKGYQGLGKDSLAISYLERAAPLDTNNNVYNIIHDIRFKQKRYSDAGKAALQSIEWKQKKNQTIGSGDYDKAALDFYLVAGLTPKADSLNRVLFAMKADTLASKAISVNDKWPVFYIRRARINSVIDFSGSKWLSVPFYEKFIETVDKLREEKSTTYKEDKNQLFEAYKYLGGFNLLIVKDDLKAKAYFTKALEIKKDDKEVNEYFTPAPAAAAPKK